MSRWSTAGRVSGVIVVLGCLAVAGCGSDDEPGGSSVRSGSTGSSEPGDREEAGGIVDGVLTSPDGRSVRAWGVRRDHLRVVSALRQLQRSFRRREFAATCAGVDDFLLSQFRSAQVRPEASCEQRMANFARSLKPVGSRTLRVLWVRSYGQIAGLWVEDPDGRRIRVPFKGLPGGGWALELGPFPSPEVLAARTTGTPARVE